MAKQEKELHQLNKKLQKELNRLKADNTSKGTEKAPQSKESKELVIEQDDKSENKTDNIQQ